MDNNDEEKRWKFGKTIGGVSNTVTSNASVPYF